MPCPSPDPRPKIRSKRVPGPLPGSNRTNFSRWVQPWRRGGPPKAGRPRTPIPEVRTSRREDLSSLRPLEALGPVSDSEAAPRGSSPRASSPRGSPRGAGPKTTEADERSTTTTPTTSRLGAGQSLFLFRSRQVCLHGVLPPPTPPFHAILVKRTVQVTFALRGFRCSSWGSPGTPPLPPPLAGV